MTRRLLSPLLMDATDSSTHGRPSDTTGSPTPLPLAKIVRPVPPRETRWAYALRRIDRGGRVIAKPVLTGLGWPPRIRLSDTTAMDGAIVRLLVAQSGRNRVTSAEDLWLAARTRRQLAASAGDQLLLAADLTNSALWVLPLHIVDRWVGTQLDSNWHGRSRP